MAMLGLSALLGSIFGRRDADFDVREMASPFKPVLKTVALTGAFIMLGLLLAVASLIAALGGGGALLAVCGLPVLFAASIAWLLIDRAKRRKAVAESDPWTIEGMAVEPRAEVGRAEPASAPAHETAAAPMPPFVSRPAVAPRPAVAQPHKPQARVQTLHERPARSPAEYRQRAASYRRKIQSLVKMRRPGPIAERMSGVLETLKNWEERVGQLADRLMLYEKDDLIQRDIRETPVHIERLRRQLALEADPEMQRQVQRTISAYQEQQRQLELLGRVMRRTRLNLDDTLAAMGTVYSQLQVLNAMDIDGPTAARIAGNVDREVERLNDLLTAMADVYSQSSERPSTAATAGEDADLDNGLRSRKARLGGTAAN